MTSLPLNPGQLTFAYLGLLKPMYLKEVRTCCIMIGDEWSIKSPWSLERC